MAIKKKSAELTSVLREVVVDLPSCANSLCCCVPVTVEKEKAIHSSVLAWRIPWTEELGVLQSMGSQKPDTT